MSIKELVKEATKFGINEINEFLRKTDPMFSYISAEIVEIKEGYGCISFPFKKELLRRGGIINGGIIMTAIDYAGGLAAMTVNDGDDQVTQELKINFLEPLQRGPFRAEGKVLRKGKNTITVEIKVYDAENKLCTVALGTWFILRRSQS